MPWSLSSEISKFLKITSKEHPIERGLYCVLGGNYGGEFFLFLRKEEEKFIFFSLPDKVIREVPQQSFHNGINYKLLEYVEKLPKRVFNEVELLIKGINNNNGFRYTKANN